jgi:hypothetical protein
METFTHSLALKSSFNAVTSHQVPSARWSISPARENGLTMLAGLLSVSGAENR